MSIKTLFIYVTSVKKRAIKQIDHINKRSRPGTLYQTADYKFAGTYLLLLHSKFIILQVPLFLNL